MMEIQHPQSFDWANDAYAAFSDQAKHQNQWTPFGTASSPTSSTAAFSLPPSLLTNSTAQFGQITPPEDRSPADAARNFRGGSIPVEDLINETLWPQTQSHDVDYKVSPKYDPQQLHSPPEDSQPSSKRRRTSNVQPSAPTQEDGIANPQPPKRKRGRPKSQPQMIEAFTADGYPFQVSSARQSHLEKNRVAAHKCRQRKKEYIGGLEGRAREFSAKNKALKENVAILREEVLSLKNEVLRHAGCGFWAVDEYLARCAGDLLGMQAPRTAPRTNAMQHHASSTMPQLRPREDSEISIPTIGSMSVTPEADDFGGLELLKDYEDDMDGEQ